MFDGVLYHFLRRLVEDNILAASKLTPYAKQKCSCMQERIKVARQSKKQVKSENIASRLTQNSFVTSS
jgi:hypothetical protein